MHEQQTWLDILTLCDELDAFLKDAIPMANPLLLRRIQHLCDRMCGPDNYISEKAGKISSRAGDYLSARKHQKHPRGADGLMHEMRYSLLGRIRDQANTRMNYKG